MNTENAEETREMSGGKSRRKVAGVSSRAGGSASTTASIKLFGESADRLRSLELEANGDGPRRVKGNDIVALGLQKITSEDLRILRQEKATVEDQFEQGLSLFQKVNPKATELDFKSHLLRLLQQTNLTN